IHLEVHLQIYYPGNQQEARQRLGFPESLFDKFIVGNVNRNQPRKRLDLTVQYFAEWMKDSQINDAYLFLHIAPTGDVGYNPEQLLKYYGIDRRLIKGDPGVWSGVTEMEMADTYRSFDVQVTTTQGEGWGLTTMEGMACGIPQIVPEWSALGEWPKD